MSSPKWISWWVKYATELNWNQKRTGLTSPSLQIFWDKMITAA